MGQKSWKKKGLAKKVGKKKVGKEVGKEVGEEAGKEIGKKVGIKVVVWGFTSIVDTLPRPILTLIVCSSSLTSHSHLSTASVVCAINSGRFGFNKYCIRTR